ncbi:hypothetical protein LguiA_013929 [Lonicera macranthoides]
MGHWSELPRELLDEIEDLLLLYVDKVRVRAVCTSWNSHLSKMPNHQVRRLPWLLQSFENATEASHGLFDLSDKKFYKLDLPEAQGKLYKGCSYGWLATIGDNMPIGRCISSNSPDIHLINPLTRAQIQLPPRYTFADVTGYIADRVGEEYAILQPRSMALPVSYYASAELVNSVWMRKVVLSSAPSNEDCLVVAIYGEHGDLAWCKCNDKEWKSLHWVAEYNDIIFYNGKLHALNCNEELLVFEDICSDPNFRKIAELPRSVSSEGLYLVECTDGGLVMVMQFVKESGEEDSLTEKTYMFKVYKLDSINSTWVEVKDIGDDILFVGLNTSFSISSRDFPGFKGNSIYYTDYWLTAFTSRREKHACSDIGVFNLEDQSFELLPGFKCNPKFLWPPPVWVMPPSYY